MPIITIHHVATEKDSNCFGIKKIKIMERRKEQLQAGKRKAATFITEKET